MALQKIEFKLLLLVKIMIRRNIPNTLAFLSLTQLRRIEPKRNLVAVAASGRTLRQAQQTLYKPVTHNLETELKRQPLEYNYDNYQKINWSIFIITILGIIIFLLQLKMKLLILGSIVLLCLIIFYSIILMFSKNGLAAKNNDLYKADFFSDKLIFKRKVKLSDNPNFSILKLRKRQKVVFSVASTDASYGLINYDIFLLNEKHTKKKYVMSLRNEMISKKASEFISMNSNLKFEIYSPDFS
ncbi:hypothetical protein [Ulvibacter antarcticus]|nr:hypothetical protein [Ulvibacter antarcticus]